MLFFSLGMTFQRKDIGSSVIPANDDKCVFFVISMEERAWKYLCKPALSSFKSHVRTVNVAFGLYKHYFSGSKFPLIQLIATKLRVLIFAPTKFREN